MSASPLIVVQEGFHYVWQTGQKRPWPQNILQSNQPTLSLKQVIDTDCKVWTSQMKPHTYSQALTLIYPKAPLGLHFRQ